MLPPPEQMSALPVWMLAPSPPVGNLCLYGSLYGKWPFSMDSPYGFHISFRRGLLWKMGRFP
eukprot:365241-Chlamydomonas_euryale.AAC.1